MLGSLLRHSFLAILLAVAVEEVGLPMPIPTDLMIVLAGTTAAGSPLLLALYFVSLSVASATGGSALYFIVRRGGRPLVDRFGRYVHLGPKQIDRAGTLLSRGGVWSIAAGRAIPGLRYATVIVCGLLKAPFRRFLAGHLLGSSVYIAVFLAIGAIFGPELLERLHLPAHALRLLLLLLLAVGLPVLLAYWGQRVRAQQPASMPRGRLAGAVLLGGFAGAIAFAATLSAAAIVAEFIGAAHPLNVAYTLLGWLLLGAQLDTRVTAVLLYAILLALLAGLALVYHEIAPKYLGASSFHPSRQVLALTLLAFCLFGGVFLVSLLFVERDGSHHSAWLQSGGPMMLLGITVGAVAYATTAVYGRVLAIAMAAPLIRNARQAPPAGSSTEAPSPPASS